jgi:hypothetical protein
VVVGTKVVVVVVGSIVVVVVVGTTVVVVVVGAAVVVVVVVGAAVVVVVVVPVVVVVVVVAAVVVVVVVVGSDVVVVVVVGLLFVTDTFLPVNDVFAVNPAPDGAALVPPSNVIKTYGPTIPEASASIKILLISVSIIALFLTEISFIDVHSEYVVIPVNKLSLISSCNILVQLLYVVSVVN